MPKGKMYEENCPILQASPVMDSLAHPEDIRTWPMSFMLTTDQWLSLCNTEWQHSYTLRNGQANTLTIQVGDSWHQLLNGWSGKKAVITCWVRRTHWVARQGDICILGRDNKSSYSPCHSIKRLTHRGDSVMLLIRRRNVKCLNHKIILCNSYLLL